MFNSLSVNAVIYQGILRYHVIASIKNNYGASELMFQQKSAPAHVAGPDHSDPSEGWVREVLVIRLEATKYDWRRLEWLQPIITEAFRQGWVGNKIIRMRTWRFKATAKVDISVEDGYLKC